MWIVALAAAALLVLALSRVAEASTVARLDQRHAPGRRLIHAPQGLDDVERVPLETLLAEASGVLGRPAQPEPFALAKMLKSEGASDNAETRRVRAWVAWNDLQALRDGKGFEPAGFVDLFRFSITRIDGVLTERGYFGGQTGRRYASQADPYEGDYLDAEVLLVEFQDRSNDPTGGATKFVDADALGIQPGTEGKTIASIEADWNLTARHVPGTRAPLYVFGGRPA